VHEQQAKMDRRTFFHTEGKSHAYVSSASRPRGTAEVWDIGERLQVKVEDVHFANPRVRVMQGEPAPMPTMLKWPPEKFAEHILDVAQISFGDYWVWCAVGISANRQLYAMKRSNIEWAQAKVVAPPPLASPDEDVDNTYGASIQGIQLVP